MCRLQKWIKIILTNSATLTFKFHHHKKKVFWYILIKINKYLQPDFFIYICHLSFYFFWSSHHLVNTNRRNHLISLERLQISHKSFSYLHSSLLKEKKKVWLTRPRVHKVNYSKSKTEVLHNKMHMCNATVCVSLCYMWSDRRLWSPFGRSMEKRKKKKKNFNLFLFFSKALFTDKKKKTHRQSEPVFIQACQSEGGWLSRQEQRDAAAACGENVRHTATFSTFPNAVKIKLKRCVFHLIFARRERGGRGGVCVWGWGGCWGLLLQK